MEKRVLLAVVLSFLVLYGYQAMFPPAEPVNPGNRGNAPATAPAASSQAPAPTTAPGATPAAEPLEKESGAAPSVAAAAAQDIVVENEAVRATFTTAGGALKSWRLKHYLDANGEPLDLVPSRAPEGSVLPFTIGADDQATAATLRSALFKPSADSLTIGDGETVLSFEYRDASGLNARKEFKFTADKPYIITFTTTVDRNGAPIAPIVQWGPGLGAGEIVGGMTYAPPSQPLFARDGDVSRVAFGEIPEQRVQEGNFEFAGIDDHYFMAALLEPQSVRIEYDPIHVPVEGTKGLQFIAWNVRFPNSPAQGRFFVGPKDFDELKAESPELTHAIDFGMFRWLVVPLLNALKWVHGYLGNYGWSIIALTILINLVMFPLRHKSVVSMRRMQELQPEVKAIQDRYSKLKMNDPARQKMNVELMNLYRERGVNPASGCVPMLLTFPVLFAFYAMLSVAIEIRGAPFVGWIKDLSIHDPLFIWPVIMAITMVVQQKMTPQAMSDPVQQKMMMLMPLVFSIMLAWAPSGLVLYWTASNLWTIGQQAVTNKLIGPPPQHTVRPPAERRLKAAGSGKSPQASRERK
jgi:YidC/Oxa1 family membrane protein insertase